MKWIKCSERMPNGHDPVLIVFTEYDGVKMVYTAVFDDEDDGQYACIIFGYANHENKRIPLSEITHWATLPQPPK